MEFALTTRWNNHRHHDGRAVIDECLELGFNRVELGYDTRLELVEGILARVEEGAIKIDSVHNFCPVPRGAVRGHPEIFTFANRDPKVREAAIYHTAKTIEFAATVGAKVVVTHCGYVETRKSTRELMDLIVRHGPHDARYLKAQQKLMAQRDRKAPRFVRWLAEALEQLLPVLMQHNVTLGLENLPSWEAVPTEAEMKELVDYYRSPHIGYWHDIGHGQIRENMGFVNAERWVNTLQPHLAGMHLHDVAAPVYDHQMPPDGSLDFTRFSPYMDKDILRVLEPSSRATPEEVARGYQFFKDVWKSTPSESPTDSDEPTNQE